MNAEALRIAEDRYRQAAAHAEACRETRNNLVRAALTANWTHARISEATGLTRGRIGQIAARDWRDKQLNGRKT